MKKQHSTGHHSFRSPLTPHFENGFGLKKFVHRASLFFFVFIHRGLLTTLFQHKSP